MGGGRGKQIPTEAILVGSLARTCLYEVTTLGTSDGA